MASSARVVVHEWVLPAVRASEGDDGRVDADRRGRAAGRGADRAAVAGGEGSVEGRRVGARRRRRVVPGDVGGGLRRLCGGWVGVPAGGWWGGVRDGGAGSGGSSCGVTRPSARAGRAARVASAAKAPRREGNERAGRREGQGPSRRVQRRPRWRDATVNLCVDRHPLWCRASTLRSTALSAGPDGGTPTIFSTISRLSWVGGCVLNTSARLAT